jgi:hypothetical protein
MGIARPQLPMPEVVALAFETEEGVIRRPTRLEGVVANRGFLLFAIHHEHGRVDVENQPGRSVWARCHVREEAIVQQTELGKRRRHYTEQESPQRGRIRIGLQSCEVLEYAILSQQLSGLDALQPEDHRIQQCQQHLADAVAIVPLGHAELPGDQVFEANSRQEPMQQIDTAVMRQRGRTELDREFARASGHGSESY